MQIRKAYVNEAAALSELCFRSKAYWGYSDEFVETCRDDLTVTADYISTGLVYVLEEDNDLRGFMGLEQEEQTGSWLLKDLFVDPDSIGKGYGKLLWGHMLGLARGARRIGEVVSSVFPGRKLPLLEVRIAESC